jgi:hypothetical protein
MIQTNHAIATKLNRLRQSLKYVEHIIDGDEEFDVRSARADLMMIVQGIGEVMELLIPTQHERHQTLDELFTEEEDKKAQTRASEK